MKPRVVFVVQLARVILLGSVFLAACGAHAQSTMHTTALVRPLEKRTEFTMDPKQPWNNTGIGLETGVRYRLTARAISDSEGNAYADKSMPCTPDGPVGFNGWLFDLFARNADFPLNPAHWAGPGKIKHLRVLRDRDGRRASFLTVVGCIGRDDAAGNTFVIGREREIVAHATGELVVFSNDWPGGTGEGEHRFDDSKSYANNKGRIVLTVERLPGR